MPSKGSTRPSSSSTPFQQIKEQIKYVDLVFEVLDGRAPFESRHPRSEEIFGHKPRVLVYTKEDLADPRRLKEIAEAARSDQQQTLVLSLKQQKGKDKLIALALALTESKRDALAKKGLLPRPMRACVVGMPNVGKSSLINWIIGRNKARTGNMPGVTKGKQWVRVHPQLELLDTPGILPHTSFSKETALRLGLLNLIPEGNYDNEEVARFGLQILKGQYPQLLQSYMPDAELDEISLDKIAEKRRFLTTGANPDLIRAAGTFISDVRAGRLGRITLKQQP